MTHNILTTVENDDYHILTKAYESNNINEVYQAIREVTDIGIDAETYIALHS